MSAFNPNKVQIRDFKMLKGQVETPEHLEMPTELAFDSEFHLSLGLHAADKLMRVDLGVEIVARSSSTAESPIKGSFLFVFVYEIENFSELVEFSEAAVPKVNASLSVALAGITYSTVRGILMTRLQGTLLEKFIMPVINPADLLGNISS
jgi:hypothetical protein